MSAVSSSAWAGNDQKTLDMGMKRPEDPESVQTQSHAAWAQVTWSGSWLAMCCVDPGAGAASGVHSAERDDQVCRPHDIKFSAASADSVARDAVRACFYMAAFSSILFHAAADLLPWTLLPTGGPWSARYCTS